MLGVRARLAITLTFASVVAAVALTAAGAGAVVHRIARVAAGAPSAIAFSHGVVVDEQRPGFEPDVKVDSQGQVYTSVPYGFSTTESFVWSSRDRGNSYQFVPGTLGPGKPVTCAGGGDTDLFVDAKDALYFSDLQGLTNITNSMSSDGGATWNTNCAGAPNTPDDRMWFAGTGSSAGGNLVLYQDYDATTAPTPNPANSPGNQLVETVSTDGTHFLPVVNTNVGGLAGDCAGAAVQNCVTDNEGISGNQVVDPKTGNVYIAHTSIEGTGGTPGVRVAAGKIALGPPATATWSESPNLDASLCPGSAKGADGSGTCVNSAGKAMELAGENFASIARDSAGYLYVTFTAGPLDTTSDANAGALSAPEQIYVVHSLEPAPADPSKLTWSAPERITGTGATSGTNTFPWIDAGSDGRVDVAFYHTDELTEKGTCASGSGTCTVYGAGNFQKAEWTVAMAQSLDAHAGSPSYRSTQVSESPIKYGQICTNGLGCATGGDRSLGDFLQVTHDDHGAALVSYVNDTSGNTSAGENFGPDTISRQIAGPGLIAGATVSRNGGPGLAMGSVTDPSGDADYSANGARTTTGLEDLDLTGASLASGPGKTLTATIHVKSLASLSASPAVGGPDASWLLRWTQVTPGTAGNGQIYYAGMDNAGGSGSPTFFAGSTAGVPAPNPGEHTKFVTFPQTDTLTGSQAAYDPKTGVITLHIPLADVGNPPAGTVLYSATAFTATSLTPQSASTLFNVIDATAPFDVVVGTPGPSSTVAPGSISGTACQAATGALAGQSLGPLRLGMTRAAARRRIAHFATRGRRDMDFFCLSPVGIRAGYASARIVRPLAPGARRRLLGSVVVLLTSDQRYSIRGIFPGERLAAARPLHLSRPLRIGRNTWYVFADGSARGVFKTAGGVIEEIGIANRSLTSTARAARRFLGAFE